MKIQLTHEESENYFYNSLCNGMTEIAGYGIGIDADDESYQLAKANMTKETSAVCYEDVLMQVLRDGNKLTMIDHEGEGDMTRSITIQDVWDRVQNTPITHLMNAVNENDDAVTADVILQTVFYEDIIFG